MGMTSHDRGKGKRTRPVPWPKAWYLIESCPSRTADSGPAVLLAAEDDRMPELIAETLPTSSEEDLGMLRVTSLDDIVDRVSKEKLLVVLVDLRQEGLRELGIVTALHRRLPDVPVIGAVDRHDQRLTRQACQPGRVDLLVSPPLSPEKLSRAVDCVLLQRQGPQERSEEHLGGYHPASLNETWLPGKDSMRLEGSGLQSVSPARSQST